MTDRTDREQLLEELIRERWPGMLPPPERRQPHARQAAEPGPKPKPRKRRLPARCPRG